jgi:hypothetical protein
MALHKTLLLGLLLLSSTLPLAGCGESQSSASSITSLPEIVSIDESEIVPAGTSTPAGVGDRPLVSSDYEAIAEPTLLIGFDVHVTFPHLTREQIPMTTIDLTLADKNKAFLYEGIQSTEWEEETDEKGHTYWFMDYEFHPGLSVFVQTRYYHIVVTGTVHA